MFGFLQYDALGMFFAYGEEKIAPCPKIGSMTLQKAIESHAALEDYLSEMREVLNGS
jgi:hypothetical protein